LFAIRALTYSLLLTFQARKIKVYYRGELKHWENMTGPLRAGINFVRFIDMIRKQNLNKNWSDLGSVLIDSLPENLQKDQKEWLGYQWNLVVGKEISGISFVDKIAQGTLHIRVQGAEWLPALESLKQNFILELNSRAGKQLVSKIKLIT